MPSEKHRPTGKSQTHKDVGKVTIKSEPVDILPLSGYVDDRVELIKQAFQCLKPKSIKSIAPEFLQDKSIEKIQEACLNEVLGMSKKRLLSIINATKCPTDTESSSDEEIQPIEAHISLDEISSDDNISKRKKKHKKNEKEEPKKEVKPVEKTEQEPKKTKEYTVLELLELQARARAIRSQLALEPVTKIEIPESDEETAEEAPVVKPPQPQAPKASSSSSSQNREKTVSSKKTKSNTEITKSRDPERNGTDESHKEAPRRIKLKRDWEKKKLDSYKDIIGGPEKIIIEVRNNLQQKNSAPEKESSEERDCGSPDVLPIVPSPETFCISDSDEEVSQDDKSSEKEVGDKTQDEVKIDKEPEKETEMHAPDQPEEGEILLELSIGDEEKTLEKEISEKESSSTHRQEHEPFEKENAKENDVENEKSRVDDPPSEEKSEEELNDDCIEIVCTDILEDHQDNADQKEDSDSQQKTDGDEEVLKIDDSSDEDNLPLSKLITQKDLDGKHN